MNFKIIGCFLIFLSGFCNGEIPPPVETTTAILTDPPTDGTTLFPPPLVSTTAAATTTATTAAATTATATATTTATTTIATTTITTPSEPCDGIESGQVIDPNECTIFYTCENSTISIIHSCPPGSIFFNDSCVPGDKESCFPGTTGTPPPSTTATTTTPTTTTTNTNTPPNSTPIGFNPCESVEYGVIADSYNCSIYYECFNSSITMIRTCSPGQIFLGSRCQVGHISECWGELIIPTTTETTTETVTETTIETTTETATETTIETTTETTTKQTFSPCFGQSGGNIPHESNCTLFYACEDGEIKNISLCDLNSIFLEDYCIAGDPSTCLPDFNVICYNVFFGARHYPGSNKMFVGCIRGMYNVMKCLENEFFDREKQECVDPNTMKRRNLAEIINFV